MRPLAISLQDYLCEKMTQQTEAYDTILAFLHLTCKRFLKYVKIIIVQTITRKLNYTVKNKELHIMSKPSATPKRNTSKFIKPNIPEQISTVTDADVSSLPKREGVSVPAKMDARATSCKHTRTRYQSVEV